jgi:hypothetical protein
MPTNTEIMKKTFPVIIFIFIINHSFGQDMTTMIKLHDVSVALGINSRPVDTILFKSGKQKINRRVTDQQSYLLKAAEYYNAKDYENSHEYIKRVVLRFKIKEYNTLRYILLIGGYANIKDIKNTAKFLYIANKTKFVGPENMNLVREAIRNNFKKDDFDNALSYYFYYHHRMKILDEIKFNE